ncbi:hypothetical protein CLV58_1031 [Spirosoma oryzae]|uniref:Uncharacterized protein n=1 Tax=Spirosoma oryzae TaxID=1469603 RepID=A0A2T0TED7_9BACT|nr:hypothetical protein CLV58_1031 [Spirosoma oryzae]
MLIVLVVVKYVMGWKTKNIIQFFKCFNDDSITTGSFFN